MASIAELFREMGVAAREADSSIAGAAARVREFGREAQAAVQPLPQAPRLLPEPQRGTIRGGVTATGATGADGGSGGSNRGGQVLGGADPAEPEIGAPNLASSGRRAGAAEQTNTGSFRIEGIDTLRDGIGQLARIPTADGRLIVGALNRQSALLLRIADTLPRSDGGVAARGRWGVGP